MSRLALRSKAHWGYDVAFMDSVSAELTLGPGDLGTHGVVVCEVGDRIVGFYGLAGGPPEAELTYLFVDPDAMGRGYGRALWSHALARARADDVERLRVVADPHAEPFYLAMGARRVGSVPGSVPGRRLPLLTVEP